TWRSGARPRHLRMVPVAVQPARYGRPASAAPCDLVQAAGRDGHGPGHAPPSHIGVDASPAWLQSVVHRVGGRGRTAIQVGGEYDRAGRGDEGVNECAT